MPELQASVFTESGRWLARCDFYWDEFGVVGEADGLDKYRAGFDAVRAEKLRQERLEMVGLTVVRWGFADLQAPGPLIGRLFAAFARAGRDRRWRTQFQPRFVMPSLE